VRACSEGTVTERAAFRGPLALVVTEIIGKTKFDAYRE